MYILLALVVGVLCISSFMIGAKIGQAASKGEEIKTPTISPIQMYKEHTAKKEAEKAQDRLDTIMQNIESYDGTSKGQTDVPGR